MENDTRSRDRLLVPNLVTTIMLSLSLVLCCAFVAALILWPKGESPTASLAEPTVFALPTFTQLPASPTIDMGGDAEPEAEEEKKPTLDLSTAEPSATSEATETRIPTTTPTPTNTPIPTSTFTPTATNTRLPYDYVLRNNKVAFSNSETWHPENKCEWQSIAGVVFNIEGRHETGVIVHVWKDGVIDERVAAGSTTLFGTSGWEVKVDDAPNGKVYYVQLENPGKDKLSEVITVDFSDSCEKNFAFLTFEQVQ